MGWRKLVLFCACLLLLQFAMGSFANALPQEEGLWGNGFILRFSFSISSKLEKEVKLYNLLCLSSIFYHNDKCEVF